MGRLPQRKGSVEKGPATGRWLQLYKSSSARLRLGSGRIDNRVDLLAIVLVVYFVFVRSRMG
ncbi:MAG: hypothetical protein WA849_03380 [Candidatus Udaeobacter sp.]